MELLLGLSLFGVGVIVTLIVPIVAWVRAAQAMNEVRQLRARVGALEYELKNLAKPRAVPIADGVSAAPEPVIVTPPATEVPKAPALAVNTPAQDFVAALPVPEPAPAS